MLKSKHPLSQQNQTNIFPYFSNLHQFYKNIDLRMYWILNLILILVILFIFSIYMSYRGNLIILGRSYRWEVGWGGVILGESGGLWGRRSSLGPFGIFRCRGIVSFLQIVFFMLLFFVLLMFLFYSLFILVKLHRYHLKQFLVHLHLQLPNSLPPHTSFHETKLPPSTQKSTKYLSTTPCLPYLPYPPYPLSPPHPLSPPCKHPIGINIVYIWITSTNQVY